MNGGRRVRPVATAGVGQPSSAITVVWGQDRCAAGANTFGAFVCTPDTGWFRHHDGGTITCMDRATLLREIDMFVDAQRDRCLWFVRRDYLPQTDDDRRWVLTQIQSRADRATFIRAGELKRWLSPTFSDVSADS